MQLKDKTLELKDKVVKSLHTWMDDRIDQFVIGNPSLVPVRKYLKRGVSNLLTRESDRIGKGIEDLMLFIADENGNYDVNMLFADALSLFKTMPETPFDMGLLHGTIGSGILRIQLPDSPLVSLFMGNVGAINLREEDFLKLKEILSKQ